MKHLKLFQTLLRCCTLLIAFNFIAFFAFSQDKETVLEPYEILATDAIGNPTFIDFISTKVKSDDASVYEFLKKVYGFDEHTTFVEKPNSSNFTNGIYTKILNQYYKGIRADFGQVIITYKDNLLRSVSGNINFINKFSITASISEKEALESTLNQINAEQYAWENEGFEQMLRGNEKDPKATHYPKGNLVIIDINMFSKDKKPNLHLAYKFEIYSLVPFDNKEYYIQAHTGKIIFEESLIVHNTGDADTRYSGKRKIQTQLHNGFYRLRDYTRGNGIETYDMNLNPYPNYHLAIDFTDNDNFWSITEHQNAQADNAALDAHWGVEMTYDYFFSTFNRNGWNKNGGLIKNFIHVDLSNTVYTNRNAGWSSSRDGTGYGTIFYGDGTEGIDFLKPWTTLDIVGHEVGHGTIFTDNDMALQGEGRIFHEGLADIWGAMVENYAAPEKRMFVHGEDLSGTPNSTFGIRYMENPEARTDGNQQPATYLASTYWRDVNDPSNGYSHWNSTVLTYWFYILCEKANGKNALGNYFNINGIGKEKVAQIVYLAQQRLNIQMDFPMMRLKTIQAAIDLFGAGSIEVKTVCQAWYAVGVGSGDCFPRIVRGSGGFGNGDPTNLPSDVDVICDIQNQTYALLFVEPSANVTWEVSSNLEKVSETTLSVTIRARRTSNNPLGHAYIIATVNGVSYRQDIWLGEPQVTTTYQQTDASLMYIYLMGSNSTDLEKQGITNVDWQLTDITGSCTPYLSPFGSNNFVKLVEANCNQWQTQLNITVTNACGSVQLTRTVASDTYLGGGGGYPCFIKINFLGQDVLVPCGSFPPFLGLRHGISQFSIHDYMYMGKHYGTYHNTNILPSKLPLGLYFIKILDTEGHLFTLKYIKS